MAITQAQAWQQILDDLGSAEGRLGHALSVIGLAYEELTTAPADRLEASLYRPIQKAYGRCKRTRAQFAERIGMDAAAVDPASPGLRSQGVRALVELAVAEAGEGDRLIAELQDTMLPVESGDPELRAGLAETRSLLAGLAPSSREFLRTLGR
jgi:hypothetical protein